MRSSVPESWAMELSALQPEVTSAAQKNEVCSSGGSFSGSGTWVNR